MKIGVVTDVVLSQRQNHVAPTALLEDARLFTDQLEGRANVALCEHLSQALRGVVIRGQQVILRVEPEDDMDAGAFNRRDTGQYSQGEDQQQEDRSSEQGSHERHVYRESTRDTRIQPARSGVLT